jgi:hypothetical protein
MAQQTAVEWLSEMLHSPVCNGFLNGQRRVIPHDIIQQAKAMEKEQIKDAWYNGGVNGMGLFETNTGEEYYNKNYKNEG